MRLDQQPQLNAALSELQRINIAIAGTLTSVTNEKCTIGCCPQDWAGLLSSDSCASAVLVGAIWLKY